MTVNDSELDANWKQILSESCHHICKIQRLVKKNRNRCADNMKEEVKNGVRILPENENRTLIFYQVAGPCMMYNKIKLHIFKPALFMQRLRKHFLKTACKDCENSFTDIRNRQKHNNQVVYHLTYTFVSCCIRFEFAVLSNVADLVRRSKSYSHRYICTILILEIFWS